MAISTVVNQTGDRSVSIKVVTDAAPQTLDLSAVAASLSSGSAVRAFLATSHTDGPGTAEAFAAEGALCSVNASVTGASNVFFSGNNTLSFPVIGTYNVRIALSYSASA